MTILVLFLVTLCYVITNAEVQLWKGLYTTWATDDNTPYAFDKMPLTLPEALKAGYKRIKDNKHFKGHRYVKDGDTSNVLIFGNNRFAGFQTHFPEEEITKEFLFWFRDGRNTSYFVAEEINGTKYYVTTTYTIDPATILTLKEGRCTAPAGCGFYHQIGPNAEKENILKIPDTIDEMSDEWIRAKCLPRMGRHYIWKLNKNTDCNDFPSFFLMYIEGKLSGFINLAVSPFNFSPRLEHPPNNADLFFYEYPDCLPKSIDASHGIISLHHYINENPASFECPPNDE